MTLSGIFHMAGWKGGAASSRGPEPLTAEEQGDLLMQNRLVLLRSTIAVMVAIVFGSLLTVSVMANNSPLSERLATLEEQVRVESKYRGDQAVLNATAIAALQADVTNIKTTLGMFNGMYMTVGGLVSLLTIISILVTLKNPHRRS